MKEHFAKLYKYNAWANDRVLGCLERQQVDDAKILRIFGHIVAAQMIWYNRVQGLPKSSLSLWADYRLPELRKISSEGSTAWQELVEGPGPLDRLLKYHNYAGDYFETNLIDLMTHMVNHGTYHRGQVAVLLREKGFEPVNTDFVTYDRIISGQLKEN